MTNNAMRQAMDELLATKQPPDVDIDSAIAAGRSRIRRNRLWTVAGTVVGVAALIGGTVAVAGSMTPDSSKSNPPASARQLAGSAPTAFDPMVRFADFGWVPDPLVERRIETSYENVHLSAASPVAATSPTGEPQIQTGPGIDVWLFPAGVDIAAASEFGEIVGDSSDPSAPPARQGSREEAANVGDRPAYWWKLADTDPVLRWEYADGAWAEMQVTGFSDAADVAYQAAASLKIGSDEKIRVPFIAEGLSSDFQPLEVSYVPASPGSSFGRINYGDTGAPFDPAQTDLTIEVVLSSARDGDGGKIPLANTELNGHPANVFHAPEYSAVTLFDVAGYRIFVRVNDETRDRLGGEEAVVQLATTVRPVDS